MYQTCRLERVHIEGTVMHSIAEKIYYESSISEAINKKLMQITIGYLFRDVLKSCN